MKTPNDVFEAWRDSAWRVVTGYTNGVCYETDGVVLYIDKHCVGTVYAGRKILYCCPVYSGAIAHIAELTRVEVWPCCPSCIAGSNIVDIGAFGLEVFGGRGR